MMTVAEFLNMVDETMDNSISEEIKVKWINELEQKLYSTLIQDHSLDEFDLVAGQNEYEPTGVDLRSIEKVEVNGIEYEFLHLSHNTEQSYYLSDGKLYLNPTPILDTTDGLKIYTRRRPTLKHPDSDATDTLTLLDEYPYNHIAVYENYLYHKICTHKREYAEANNYAMLYNEAYGELIDYIYSRKPRVVNAKRRNHWRPGF